jgi:hypothetical protein
MRCWASSAVSAAAAVLLLAGPAAAAPVDRFARATLATRAEVHDAAVRAGGVARQCLDVLRAAPLENRESLAVAFELDVTFGLLKVDAPIMRRWGARLERIRLRREPALMAARRILRGQRALIDVALLTLDRTCTVAREWQAAGWRTPPRSIRLQRRFLTIADSYSQETDAAEGRLRRAGHPRAARILSLGGGNDRELIPEDDPVRAVLGSA